MTDRRAPTPRRLQVKRIRQRWGLPLDHRGIGTTLEVAENILGEVISDVESLEAQR